MTYPKDPSKVDAYIQNLKQLRKGTKLSEEHKRKISESMKGHVVSEETKDKISKGRIGKYGGENHNQWGKSPSEESKRRMRETNIKTWASRPDLREHISKTNGGRNNGGYIDGRWEDYPLYISIRGCTKMGEWRRDVFRRDKYTCQISGTKGHALEPHHIKSLSDICHENNIQTIEEAIACEPLWDISNGITLEKKLHRSLHSQYGKQIPTSLFPPITYISL